jgi:hypothetical protein
MDYTVLLVQAVAGIFGGSAAGAAIRPYSLRALGNTVAGAIGGGTVGYLIRAAVPDPALAGWTGNIVAGAVGGAVLVLLIGAIKQASKKTPPGQNPE